MYKDKQISVIYNIPKEQSKGYVSFKRTPLDTSKIEKYGWTPKVKLQEGITKTVQFLRILTITKKLSLKRQFLYILLIKIILFFFYLRKESI